MARRPTQARIICLIYNKLRKDKAPCPSISTESVNCRQAYEIDGTEAIETLRPQIHRYARIESIDVRINYHRISTAPIQRNTPPTIRAALIGKCGTFKTPKWSNTSDVTNCPITIKATMVNAPNRDKSRIEIEI